LGRQLRRRWRSGRGLVRAVVERACCGLRGWSMRRLMPLAACMMAGAGLLGASSVRADVTPLHLDNPPGQNATSDAFDSTATATTPSPFSRQFSSPPRLLGGPD